MTETMINEIYQKFSMLLPEVVTEIVNWGLASNAVIAVIFFFLTVSMATLAFYIATLEKKSYADDYTPPFILSAVLALFFFFVASCSAYDAAKAYAAPKVYVIDYLISNTKGR